MTTSFTKTASLIFIAGFLFFLFTLPTHAACGVYLPSDQSPNETAGCFDSNNNQISGGVACTNQGAACCSPASECEFTSYVPEPKPKVDIFEGPSAQNFNDLNPLRMFNSPQRENLSSPGGIVSRLLEFAFPLAGLILFAMLVWGGFEMVVGAASKGIEAGRQRITNALIGFTLLFVAYWIFQIVEFVFGIVIL